MPEVVFYQDGEPIELIDSDYLSSRKMAAKQALLETQQKLEQLEDRVRKLAHHPHHHHHRVRYTRLQYTTSNTNTSGNRLNNNNNSFVDCNSTVILLIRIVNRYTTVV